MQNKKMCINSSANVTNWLSVEKRKGRNEGEMDDAGKIYAGNILHATAEKEFSVVG